ncbi:Solute carrier family 22 member 27 [Schistosoma japonicum]|uniref:Solute carrier family 22 member 27 n=1 Tax=Schistosoma japonicum TaxID=6182 RepID=A0A4Z2CKD4_SCHJA|nr:Solute carrier family 22 member 27 [Schistosoma japonicum]
MVGAKRRHLSVSVGIQGDGDPHGGHLGSGSYSIIKRQCHCQWMGASSDDWEWLAVPHGGYVGREQKRSEGSWIV